MARETKAPMETIFAITCTIFVHVSRFGWNTYPNHCHAKAKSRSNWPGKFGLPAGVCFSNTPLRLVVPQPL